MVPAVVIASLSSNAVCVAVDIGLPASVVLSTSLNPTCVLVIPVGVPVKAGDASGAFKFNADCVEVDIGLPASVVLSTLLNPTVVLVRVSQLALAPSVPR